MIVIVGESASGKSTIEKILQRLHGIKKVISYTTRPMRQGETDGVDYYFITKEKYDLLNSIGFFAETIYYSGSGYYYAAAKQDCTNESVIVVVPEGLKQLLAKPELNIISFYIKSPETLRFCRMVDRGDDVEAVFKRIKEDKEVFLGVEELCTYVIPNDNDLNLFDMASYIVNKTQPKKGEQE